MSFQEVSQKEFLENLKQKNDELGFMRDFARDAETTFQPYMVEIQPERGEWIKKEEITSRNLSPPLQNIGEQLMKKP